MAVVGFEEYGAGIGEAWTVLREHARRAGRDTAVPTCPGWTVRDLVAHTGMVHRWVTGVLRGVRIDSAAVEEEGRLAADQLDWLDRGLTDLLQAFVDTPADAEVWFLLPTDRAPREAWARRQCHETTVHAIDAMTASLRRRPTTAETWLRADRSADGVDELITGFLGRTRAALRLPEPTTLLLEATDTGHSWTVVLSPDEPPAPRRGSISPGHLPADPAGDVVVRGPATDLFVTLWNRATPPTVTVSDPTFLPAWRHLARF